MPVNIDVLAELAEREGRTERAINRTAKAQKGAQSGSHLYVIESEVGLVKIGRSNDPRKRCAALQTASGMTLRIAKILKDRGHEERAIHLILKAHRKNGEWFHDTGEFRGDLYLAIGESSNFRRPCVSRSEERRVGKSV